MTQYDIIQSLTYWIFVLNIGHLYLILNFDRILVNDMKSNLDKMRKDKMKLQRTIEEQIK